MRDGRSGAAARSDGGDRSVLLLNCLSAAEAALQKPLFVLIACTLRLRYVSKREVLSSVGTEDEKKQPNRTSVSPPGASGGVNWRIHPFCSHVNPTFEFGFIFTYFIFFLLIGFSTFVSVKNQKSTSLLPSSLDQFTPEKPAR